MSQGSEAQLIREFREILARDELAEDVTVVCGVSGGIPSQQPGDRDALGGEIGELKLAGDGNLTAPGAPPVRLDSSETRQLLELVASSLDSMVPQGEARFLPDSVIGFVTIAVHGKETTLYFLADESQRFGQSERIARSATEGTRPLREMLQRARRPGGGRHEEFEPQRRCPQVPRNDRGNLGARPHLPRAAPAASVSLRTRLESLARKEHSLELTEPGCSFYGATAAFEQTWTHVRVRIHLHPTAGISGARLKALQSTWGNGIATTWSDRRGCGHPGEIACPLTFDVAWVTSGAHHEVAVHRGTGRGNMNNWYTDDDGNTAAHEFGHMIGHPDEYPDTHCPHRHPVNTGTIMDELGERSPTGC